MSRIAGLKGMRHIALKVRNLAQSKQFYREMFGMDVVWEPDSKNAYLSSGCDNLALHEVPENFLNTAEERQLDHLGFLVESIERVAELEETSAPKASRSCTRSRSIGMAVRRFTAPIRTT
jgi:catechol 2,3-dioxygenase-like lactoylglutathione lyase family enzyme